MQIVGAYKNYGHYRWICTEISDLISKKKQILTIMFLYLQTFLNTRLKPKRIRYTFTKTGDLRFESHFSVSWGDSISNDLSRKKNRSVYYASNQSNLCNDRVQAVFFLYEILFFNRKIISPRRLVGSRYRCRRNGFVLCTVSEIRSLSNRSFLDRRPLLVRFVRDE